MLIRETQLHDHLSVLERALPEYSICWPTGSGAQGMVVHAVHRTSGRPVAIKILNGGPLAGREQQLRFRREIDMLFQLQHRNIVATYDCGAIDGRLYYVMQYIDGLAITDWAVAYEPTPRECVELVLQVCDGLGHAHRRGVIHRDLKPNNILVDDSDSDAFGRPYLVDFGLARSVLREAGGSSGAFRTRIDQVVGTLAYMSPEQLSNTESGPDVRSDIYSLGVVMYEVLSGGSAPYPAVGENARLRDHILRRKPVRLDALAPEIDGDLASIVAKTLEKDAELRYKSVDDLADDLRRWQAREAVVARSSDNWYRLRKTVRKHRKSIAIAIGFVLLLLAGVVGTTVMWRRAERVATIAQAGLAMAHYDKLGSSERDAGRIDSACALLTKSIEIGEQVNTDDRHVCRYLYGAYHRMAEMMYAENRAAEGDQYCSGALDIANRMASRYPNEPEWRRIYGMSLSLRGKMEFNRGAYEAALSTYNEAATVREALVEAHPDEFDLHDELASVLGRQGRCLRMLGRCQEAFERYNDAQQIRAQLYKAESTDDRALALCFTELRLAAWHLSCADAEGAQQASAHLDRIEALIHELRELGRLDSRSRDVARLLNAVSENRRQLDEG